AYDQQNGMFASRLWWMLRWLGHDAVAVVDGGFEAWTKNARRPKSVIETRKARTFAGSPRSDMLIGAPEAAAHLADPSWRLVDARAPERYRGDVEPLDKVGGHIPGAANHFFQTNLDERGLF